MCILERKKENMAATFKCKNTGNTVTFRDDVDIVGMRMHPEYTEVQSTDEVYPEQVQSYSNQEQEAPEQQQSIVKRGRPPKKD